MTRRTWKEHLLHSGLPLEQSVMQVIQAVPPQDACRRTWRSEYTYTRPNEHGEPTDFSVDIQLTQMGDPWLEFFIECKYRHDSVRWIFTPEEYAWWTDETFGSAFVILDELADKKVDTLRFREYGSHYPLCGKGIELLPDGTNPKTITQSISQLKFALAEEVPVCLEHQIDRLLGPSPPIFVMAPIVVTTAQLWRFQRDVSLEDIRQAQELDQVAEELGALITRQPPDNQLERHIRTKIEDGLTDEQKRKYPGYDLFLSTFPSRYPSYFFVVQYDHFEQVLGNLLAIFDAKALVRPRTT